MASTRRETTKPGPLCSVHQPRPVRSAGSRKRRSVVTNDTISAATTTGLVDAMEYVATSSLHTDVGLTEATLESTRQGPQDRLSRSTQAPKPWVTHHGISRRMMSLNPVEGDPVRQLEHMDRFWSGLRAKSPNSASKEPTVVRVSDDRIPIDGPGEAPSTSRTHDCDVVVCGGTLGIAVALSLQLRGHRVCVVERNPLLGRTQEWNTSREELASLVRESMLREDELEACIRTEYPKVRVGIHGGRDVWASGVLDIGVCPVTLIDILRRRFEAAGGIVLENTAFRSATVHSDGVLVRTRAVSRARGGEGERGGAGRAGREIRARVVLDCMGHYSPIVRQMRGGAKPEGIVMVVGGCHEGIPAERNVSGDLLCTIADSHNDLQMYWEAFPADGGAARTTYMFTYCDAQESRPSIEAMLDHYFTQLPNYQGVPLEDLTFKRVLFGAFPAYSDGPLRPAFDRIVQIGDASASQSPLSFGGFGCLLRHLPRLAAGISHALQEDRLSRSDLSHLHPYQPSLSLAWLYQRSMALPVGSALPKDHVNRLLRCSFSVMAALGESVIKPFLQDTIQLLPLSLTMAGMSFKDPLCVSKVGAQVGAKTFASWFLHAAMLVLYTAAHHLLRLVSAVAPPLAAAIQGSYFMARLAEALAWGSGLDNHGQGAVGGCRREHERKEETEENAAEVPVGAAVAAG